MVRVRGLMKALEVEGDWSGWLFQWHVDVH